MRQPSSIFLPIFVTVVMMGLNVVLMVVWILAFSGRPSLAALTLGTIAFAFVLIGLSYYLFLTIKERQLQRQQINFVDSVTHELKTPIAALRLYLETIKLRELSVEKRCEFYQIMDSELTRLDALIDQLLQVARLDAIGNQSPTNVMDLDTLIQTAATQACVRHQLDSSEVFSFQLQPVNVAGPRIALEMIFGNLIDNAIKYGGSPVRVKIVSRLKRRNRIEIRIADNGEGIAIAMRKKIFRLFFRLGNELQRTKTGTGVGLHIVRTLVKKLGGQVSVENGTAEMSGSVFVVELPCTGNHV